ncbi:MAG: phosphonate ABC transporter, permease protein PhnE [Rhodospirillales bacterium]|nr:MAG: phosphonate ABC transporter, permease protein PhnE [Rhodospirillales bacterium]
MTDVAVSVTRGDRSRRWRKPPFITDPRWRWGLYLGALAYLLIAAGTVEINWSRAVAGIDRGVQFVAAFLQPNFTDRGDDIVDGFLESIAITITSTIFGIILSVPVALGAARNLAPLPVYLVCRGIIAVSRAFQEVIIAILFVAMFGFGPFAGVVTLAFATIGFLAKLLAEDIEDIEPTQVEAIRATGGSWFQVLNYAIQPQVAARFTGLSLYRLDINFRESAVIGIVGAGGIGATLNTAISRYDYDSAAAVLLVIIGVVLAVEYSSGYIRRRLL